LRYTGDRHSGEGSDGMSGPVQDAHGITETLPDFNAAIVEEIAGLDFARVTVTLDICSGRLMRYTISREKSVKVEAQK
jgi:hypothetical protein